MAATVATAAAMAEDDSLVTFMANLPLSGSSQRARSL